MVYFDAGIDEGKSPAFAMTVVIVQAIVGALSLLSVFLLKYYIVGAVFGGIGLVLGGYSFGKAYLSSGSSKVVLMTLVVFAMLASVIGFMMGFFWFLKG